MTMNIKCPLGSPAAPTSRRPGRFTQTTRNALVLAGAVAASAGAFGDIVGSQVVNNDGTVTYSYVVDNSAGSFDVAAWSLEFGFPTPDWNQVDVPSGGHVTVPTPDWLADIGTPVAGLSAQDFLALAPGADVLVGNSLSSFSFTSRFLPGSVTFYEFSANGDFTTGTTLGPVAAVPDIGGSLEAISFAAVAAFAARTRQRARAPGPRPSR